MGLLKHLRSKSRLKEEAARSDYSITYPIHTLPRQDAFPQRGPQRDTTARLPDRILALIFICVCPHTRDVTFKASEESALGDGCMLCDLRDLARCAQVSRKWYSIAQGLLYRSVRIDAVHYCALEEELADKRKKSKFRSKKDIEPIDVPQIRLQLFARSVKENANLATQVRILKLPYMTRETAKGDLARAISALPSLQYVDLPDGFYSGDPSCLALRQELQMRCPDIRKMIYRAGSEEALELLAQRRWQKLEILEISSLALEPATLRIVLASLPTLSELTLSDLPWLDDSIFMPAAGHVPDFPSLQSLTMVNIPRVTAAGFTSYLEDAQAHNMLVSLTLERTGVSVPDLYIVLHAAPSLQHLSISEIVSKSLGLNTQALPALASFSLKTLHYEITSSEEIHGLTKPADSYYFYLATSLHRNGLPALETLYVRDQKFPELLLMPPLSTTRPKTAEKSPSKVKSSNLVAVSDTLSPPRSPTTAMPPPRFNQKLEIFTKGLDEVEWVFTSITPPSSNNHASASGGRPLSAYSASRGLGPQWAQGGFGGEARKSVMVGNGFGGFVAIPQDEAPRPVSSENYLSAPRSPGFNVQSPTSSTFLKPPPSMAALAAGEKRNSKHDLWR